MSASDDRPQILVHTDHNPDEIRMFCAARGDPAARQLVWPAGGVAMSGPYVKFGERERS